MTGTIFVVIIISAIIAEIFWFMQLLHLMERNDSSFQARYDKLCWVAVLLFANFVGAFAYLILKPVKADSLPEDYKPESINPEDCKIPEDGPKKCPKCGQSTFYNKAKCLHCGWSYREEKK
jgi:hypothetical protein